MQMLLMLGRCAFSPLCGWLLATTTRLRATRVHGWRFVCYSTHYLLPYTLLPNPELACSPLPDGRLFAREEIDFRTLPEGGGSPCLRGFATLNQQKLRGVPAAHSIFRTKAAACGWFVAPVGGGQRGSVAAAASPCNACKRPTTSPRCFAANGGQPCRRGFGHYNVDMYGQGVGHHLCI